MSTTDLPPTIVVERRGNGFAVTALVLGIIGIVFGLIPLFFWIAFPCGALALIFGAIGWIAARRPEGARKGMAIAGTVLGTLAFALGVWGAVIVDDAVSDLERDLDRIEQEVGRP